MMQRFSSMYGLWQYRLNRYNFCYRANLRFADTTVIPAGRRCWPP
jgi:hypothetical protein